MTRSDSHSPLRLALAVPLLAGLSLGMTCDNEPTPDAGPKVQWFRTCGDPVCSTFQPPPGAVLCTAETVGDTCSTAGASCVIPDDDCNASLLCTDADPATECPISQRHAKRDIHYLTPAERAHLAQQLIDTRLASYRYREQSPTESRRLGFIIDDAPTGPAVLPRGDRVDLYGYTSMAVAAVQEQAQELDQLRARLLELERELYQLRARPAPVCELP